MSLQSSRGAGGDSPNPVEPVFIPAKSKNAYQVGIRLAQAEILHHTADGDYPHQAGRVLDGVRKAIDAVSELSENLDLGWRGDRSRENLQVLYEHVVALADLADHAFVSESRINSMTLRLSETKELVSAALREVNAGLATWFEAGWLIVPLWTDVGDTTLPIESHPADGPNWRDEPCLSSVLAELQMDREVLFREPDLDDQAWYMQVGDYIDELWSWYWVEKGVQALTVGSCSVAESSDSPRPAYDRDNFFLTLKNDEGKKPAAIRDQWNTMSDAGRRAVAPSCPDVIGDGRPGCDVVKTALRKALEERAAD